MQQCYILPGILGSELRNTDLIDDTLWVSYGRLLLGQFGRMRLGPDGISPGPPDGQVCTPRDPLGEFYFSSMYVLRQQLEGKGITVLPWGYDWRKEIRAQGELLAASIRSTSSAADPATLVGHSQGGLVARAAWASLVASGETAKVRRIVTIGTPHYGSYAIVEIFSYCEDSIKQVVGLTSQAASIQRFVVPLPVFYASTEPEVVALAGTWPAVYELLPSLDGGGAATDPHRAIVYSATAWPADRGVSPAWLAHAAGPWRSFLASAASRPPASVLTCVAGYGFSSRYGMEDPGKLGQAAAMGLTSDGDGTVTEASALLEGSRQYRIAAAHVDLFAAAVNSGELVDWITDDSPPPPPPQTPISIPGQFPATLAGPPIPYLSTGPGRGTVQRRG